MQTISRARPPGPGWGDGGEPWGRAGCTRGPGPEVTQRSRGHQRQPLALAAIPRVPRPPLSLQRPARPAVPSRVKFPAAGWEPHIRRLQWAPGLPAWLRGLRRARARLFPALPLSQSSVGRGAPRGRAHRCLPGRGTRAGARPVLLRHPLASLPRWRLSIALSIALPCGRRLAPQPSALRSGLEAADHAPRLPARPVPRSPPPGAAHWGRSRLPAATATFPPPSRPLQVAGATN